MSATPSDSSSPDARLTTAHSLQLEVNGAVRTLPESATVAELLEDLGLAGKRVAVAVNRSVIVRSRYAEARLANGDRIEILEAVGGG